MPPPIALLLGCLFIAFLIQRDHKQASDVSSVTWIPTIWMLYAASRPIGVWLGGQGMDADGSLYDRIFLILLFLIGLLFLLRRRCTWSKVIREQPWLFMLAGYMLISILWSDIPFTSFKRWFREFIAIFMGFIIITERKPRLAVQSVFRRVIYILIPLSLVLAKYFPEYGVLFGRWSGEVMWVGVTTQKNSLGRLSMIASFFLIWTLTRKWRGDNTPVVKYQTFSDVIVLLLSLWLLKGPPGSYAATAIVALCVGLIIYGMLLLMKSNHVNWGKSSVVMIFILMFVIVFGVVTVLIGGSTVGGFVSVLGRDVTLTGRVGVWASLLPSVKENLLFGFGFGGFWTNITREYFNISGAHSGYLAVLLEMGFIGLLIVSIYILSSFNKAFKELDIDFGWASLWICMLFMTVIHNIAESSINSFTSQIMVVLLFLSFSSVGYRRMAENNQAAL